MAATTRNSTVNLVQISTFFVRTQLHEDMDAEGHLGPSAYSMLRDASGLSGRRGTRKSWCDRLYPCSHRKYQFGSPSDKKRHPFSERFSPTYTYYSFFS